MSKRFSARVWRKSTVIEDIMVELLADDSEEAKQRFDSLVADRVWLDSVDWGEPVRVPNSVTYEYIATGVRDA